MGKVNKPCKISATITLQEKAVLEELDTIITESRAEFIRRVTIREARKTIKKGK